jgi:hypothetical protein
MKEDKQEEVIGKMRDLLRKRGDLLNHRTIHELGIRNQYWRNTAIKLKADYVKRRSVYLEEFEDENNQLALFSNYETMPAFRNK